VSAVEMLVARAGVHGHVGVRRSAEAGDVDDTLDPGERIPAAAELRMLDGTAVAMIRSRTSLCVTTPRPVHQNVIFACRIVA
jgi:hypothetical protein